MVGKRCELYHATQVAVKLHQCAEPSEEDNQSHELDDVMEVKEAARPTVVDEGAEGPEVVTHVLSWIRSDNVNVDQDAQ
ncbi:hypothetical protein RvY_04901 [Ramazzottius varieornatus]|uniref:Uncharacterized protein n=1 Tax=Ramazzottius varieornatus TaxID=947166 RepID=A0A1D1UZU3_RAMVA|nr:hypothetical protein RvY_04901 [Ramazzottius varieornatus]